MGKKKSVSETLFLHLLAGSWKSCNFAGRKPIVCVPFKQGNRWIRLAFCFVSLSCSRNIVHVSCCGFAYLSPGLACGPRPTWGRGARHVRLALDVGLDSFVLSHQGERTIKDKAAATRQKKKKSLSSCSFTKKL